MIKLNQTEYRKITRALYESSSCFTLIHSQYFSHQSYCNCNGSFQQSNLFCELQKIRRHSASWHTLATHPVHISQHPQPSVTDYTADPTNAACH